MINQGFFRGPFQIETHSVQIKVLPHQKILVAVYRKGKYVENSLPLGGGWVIFFPNYF